MIYLVTKNEGASRSYLKVQNHHHGRNLKWYCRITDGTIFDNFIEVCDVVKDLGNGITILAADLREVESA